VATVEVLTQYLEYYVNKVAQALIEEGRPATRVIPLIPGVEAAWDESCDGLLYSRIETVIPNVQTPRPVSGSCRINYFTVTAAMGIIRCAATMDSRGNPPTVQEITADGLEMGADLATLAYQIQTAPETVDLVRWLPAGPMGGMHGGEWFFTFRLGALVREG